MTGIRISRRGVLSGLLSALAAPAVVKAASLMPIRGIVMAVHPAPGDIWSDDPVEAATAAQRYIAIVHSSLFADLTKGNRAVRRLSDGTHQITEGMFRGIRFIEAAPLPFS